MAQITVDVDRDVVPYLYALAVVRNCSVEDLVRTALTHVRVTQVERQRVAYYRMLQVDGHHVPGM